MAALRASDAVFERELSELETLDVGGDQAGGSGDAPDPPSPVDFEANSLDPDRPGEDDRAQNLRGPTALYQHPFVVSPDWWWRKMWDAQMVFVLVWLGITLPYRISFNSPGKLRAKARAAVAWPAFVASPNRVRPFRPHGGCLSATGVYLTLNLWAELALVRCENTLSLASPGTVQWCSKQDR